MSNALQTFRVHTSRRRLRYRGDNTCHDHDEWEQRMPHRERIHNYLVFMYYIVGLKSLCYKNKI